MTEDELNAIVESKLAARLAARLQADRERVRVEVITKLRREAESAHHDKVNRRHAIQGLGDPQVEAARLAAMDLRARADSDHLDRVNSRPIEGSLLDQRRRAALVPGSEGFRFK
jgi:hypothetical protein